MRILFHPPPYKLAASLHFKHRRNQPAILYLYIHTAILCLIIVQSLNIYILIVLHCVYTSAMAMFSASRLFLLYLVMLGLVQVYVETADIGASTTVVEHGNGMKGRLLLSIDCSAACGERCKKASRHNMCLRACGTCCARCNCVPPGTSGNQDLCPCYANQTTHGGRRKCP